MKQITIPLEVDLMLQAGAALSVSTSSGKDSQAMTVLLTRMHRQTLEWTGEIYNIHAHLGRSEWPQSLPHAERIAGECGLPLVIVRNERGGDLLDRIERRVHTLADRHINPFPSAKQRFCTSDMKRTPLQKHQRRHRLLVSSIGIRREESSGRRLKYPFLMDKQLTAKRLRLMTIGQALRERKEKERLAVIWHPLIDFRIGDVWEACGTTEREIAIRRALYREGKHEQALAGCPVHPAYIFGAKRLSCSLCILADLQTLRTGARHNPELHRAYVRIEQQSGWTFQPGRALATLDLSEPPLTPLFN